MKIIEVNALKQYPIYVGNDILKEIGDRTKKLNNKAKVLVITDDNVFPIYGEIVTSSLNNVGLKTDNFIIPNGEKSKNLKVYSEILEFMAAKGFTRSDIIIALGGGVVGDLAGFVAATFMRGIKFIQIPTTILSQIDSSVGGKTAVDLPQGKNLVGAFYQPEFVLCDISTTKTLSKEIYIDGLGEMAKYAVLIGDSFLDLILNNKDNLSKIMKELIILCIEYKRDIVEKDEFENGCRKILNLGHTVAHSIEKLSNYTITHGKAVGMGLKEIVEISNRNKFLSDDDMNKINNMLEALGQLDINPFSMSKCIEVMNVDKKCDGEEITLVIPYEIGDCRFKKIKLSSIGELIE